ncbi:MAG: hypothetical protein JJV98_03510 [Desulfosarcina sp.]|nr:hypothetical protein [Desulfobacterales bacterium]
MVESITAQDLQNMIKAQTNIRVLDVRRKADFAGSPQKIIPARWQDPERVNEWLATVPTDQDIVVYCVKGGGVSQSIADQLARKQCRVKFVQGGIKAWREIGGPLA